jgi:tetratricopeptide (TPR) repeat protein
MKSIERHRLKENEVALSVTRLRDSFEQYQREITIGIVAVVVLVAAAGGYYYWRGRTDAQARSMLSAAMAIDGAEVVVPTVPEPPAGGTTATPAAAPVQPPGTYPTEKARLEAALPKFLALADAYPGTTPGIAARYQAGSVLLQLGRAKEAMDRYHEVIDRAGDGLYGDMAKLGLADAQAADKQYDAAIVAYQQLAVRKDGNLPVDGVLMQLGRVYAMAGRKAEALKTFQRIVDEFPQSGYAAAAKKQVDDAKVGA